MNAIALLGLGLLQVSDHAAQHPPDAALYVEVPDVSAAVDALDRMPLPTLLRDPRLTALAA